MGTVTTEPQATEESQGESAMRKVIVPKDIAEYAEMIKAKHGGTIGGIIARHARPSMRKEVGEVLAEAQADLASAGA
jgi:hypothetical protein